jgi:hypothetical protein
VEEPSFFSELMEDPMIPMAGGGLLALLLGFGAWRVIQRRRWRWHGQLLPGKPPAAHFLLWRQRQ